MNACEQFQSLVSDLAAGVDMAEGPYRAHVRACEDCESWAQSVFWQDRVLAEMAGEARIDILLGRIRGAILNTAPTLVQAETPPPLRIRRPQPRWGRGVAAAAAILVALLGGWLLLRKPSTDAVVVKKDVEKPGDRVVIKEPDPLPDAPKEVRTPPIHDEAPTPLPLPVLPNPATAKKDLKPAPVRPQDPPLPPKADKVEARVPDKVGPPIPIPIDLKPRTTEEAVRLGVAFLRGKCEGLANLKGQLNQKSQELVLWTMLHGGFAPHEPEFLNLLKAVLEAKLERTYEVALQAMLLEELDRVSYQWRIQQCAQFLVDNQGKSGLWGYGAQSIFVEEIATPSGSKVAGYVKRASAELDKDGKPKVKNRPAVKVKRPGVEAGDHSNSMYAALGLRACHDAGVLIPLSVVDLAQKAWRDAQVKGEGGWCYGRHEGHKPYGSMTSGGVGSLVIYDYIRGVNWKKDADVQEGLAWLAKNFSVTWNPGFHEHAKAENTGHHLYYYLYALERAAILYGTEQIGKREWYAEGSKALLGSQLPHGAWAAKEGGNEVWDTCFAVLFLQRSTRALPAVVTGGPK